MTDRVTRALAEAKRAEVAAWRDWFRGSRVVVERLTETQAVKLAGAR